jgi:uncharacterized iron-regulated protein
MKKQQFLKGIFLGVFGITFCSLSVSAAGAGAKVGLQEQIYEGRTLGETSLETALSTVKAGTVIVLGEHHAHAAHQKEQLQVIETLQKTGHLVSVGMEFFTYTDQSQVDLWRLGKLTEADFLAKIGWGNGFPFDFYRAQVSAPKLGTEYVVALNAPRNLTGKVAKNGLGALTAEEMKLMPPQFQVGNSRYFERFKQNVGHLPDPAAAQNYFAAQSIWDDTMAWQVIEFFKAHPEQVLVIIVGEFHVQYGGGLPDRLQARGIRDLVTFSLVDLEGLTPDEEKQELEPSPLDGPRAHFIWASKP